MKHASLLVAFLASALCLSRVSAQAPSPPLTGKIAHITILGTKNILLDTVRAILTLHPGDVYTPEATARDVAAIKGIGFFYAVTDKETADPAGGVNVVYTMSENPLIQTIKFTTNATDGKLSVPFSKLIAQMKTQPGQVLNTNVLVNDLNNLFNHTSATAGYVVKQGYLMDVSSDINLDPKTGVLTIPLVEYYIKSVEVTGNSRVKTADILAQMHIKPGDLYDANILNNDLSAIYETGEFKQIKPFQIKKNGPGKVSVTIAVVEQPAATGSLNEKQGMVIPFLYDFSVYPYPVVQVSVNGHSPLPFLLDTGSSPAVSLSPEAAKELGIKVSSRPETGNGFTFTRVSIKSAILQGQDKNNNVALDTKEADVLDLSLLNFIAPDAHIAGIIGLGALRQVTSRFDFSAKTLTMFFASHPPLHIPNATALPLQGNSYGTLAVRATLTPGIYADMIIDTGSSDTQLPLFALTVLHPIAIAYDNYEQRIDGTFATPKIRLPSLTIGTLRVPNVEVSTLPSPTRLSLGLDILTDYRLTLDAPNGQLIVEPSAHSERYPRGHSGLETEPSGGGWMVSSLSDISPARTAGLKVGDQLIAVAGMSVQGLSDAQVGRLFAVRLGTSLQVRVRRVGKEISLSWVPMDAFTSSLTTIDGLPMQKAPGGPWVISEVMQGYPNAKAGLRVGDMLTKINGEATATMLLKRFVELVEKPAISVEVERPGLAQPFTVRLSAAK